MCIMRCNPSKDLKPCAKLSWLKIMDRIMIVHDMEGAGYMTSHVFLRISPLGLRSNIVIRLGVQVVRSSKQNLCIMVDWSRSFP